MLTAHPDLAGKLAAAKRLTPELTAEQAGAGLDALTDAERARFTELNGAYQAKFGFPFIIAVRGLDKARILDAFETRVGNDRADRIRHRLRAGGADRHPPTEGDAAMKDLAVHPGALLRPEGRPAGADRPAHRPGCLHRGLCGDPEGGLSPDIVTSFLPFWEKTRAWIIARPLSGFAETFSQYVMEVAPGGGSDRPEPDAGAQGVLFVTEGEFGLTLAGKTHRWPGRLCLHPGRRPRWSLNTGTEAPARFHWIRKAYEAVEGLAPPEPIVTNETRIAPSAMPDTEGRWATTRFVDPADLRHDMHVTVVTFQPGG